MDMVDSELERPEKDLRRLNLKESNVSSFPLRTLRGKVRLSKEQPITDLSPC